MKLKISVTKEILEKSKYCGMDERTSNCAIALAIKDIFPEAIVGTFGMFFHKQEKIELGRYSIYFSDRISDFIKEFDHSLPVEREEMEPISFEINIPESIIDQINISEVTELLKNHPTLSLTA